MLFGFHLTSLLCQKGSQFLTIPLSDAEFHDHLDVGVVSGEGWEQFCFARSCAAFWLHLIAKRQPATYRAIRDNN
jgi:hypothetical protein